MRNLSSYSYVCEFEVLTDQDLLNSEVMAKLNSIEDMDSVDPGSFTLSECDYDRKTLRGRYYLKSDMVAETIMELEQTFKKDLSTVALKAPVEFLRIQPLQVLILDKLTLMHSLENYKVYVNPLSDEYLVVTSDRYCEGVYSSEAEAIASIE